MWSTFNRLQLAARLQLALRYKHGVGIDMRLLLRHRRYAREAVELCHESGDHSLSELASHFEEVSAEEDAKAHLAVAAEATRSELAELLSSAPETDVRAGSRPRAPASSLRIDRPPTLIHH